MTGITRARTLLAGLTALVLASCGGTPAASPNASSSPSATAGSGAGPVNDADVQFAQMMIPHHQQAVQMADLASRHATDPQIKRLASQIEAAQNPEIQTLTRWLTAWGKQPLGHAVDHMPMPGMMSNDDLVMLMTAKGTDFDRAFARMMIAHHNGAIQMAKDEQAKGVNPDAKALAATVERTQTAEITTLQGTLDRL